MPISKEQPMRPYLKAIGDIIDVISPDGVESILARLDVLETNMTQAQEDIRELQEGAGQRGFTIAQGNSDNQVTFTFNSTAHGEVTN